MIVRAAAIVALLLMQLGPKPSLRVTTGPQLAYLAARSDITSRNIRHRWHRNLTACRSERLELKMESIPSIISSAPNQVAVRLAACAEARYTGQDT